MTQRLIRTAIWLFVGLALVSFFVRGPARAVFYGHRSADFAAPFAATEAFVQGRSPYDGETLRDVLGPQNRELGPDGKPVVSTSLYPPPTFVILAPFTLFDWPTARVLLLLANLGLGAWHLFALLRLARLRWPENPALLVTGGVLALAPYHTGIALGQLGILSVTVLVIGLHLIDRGRHTQGALALAAAVLLKPQLAAPFIAYYAIRRQWNVVGIAVGACAVASVASVAWLAWHDIAWLEGWRANIAFEMSADIDPRGIRGFHMVDARVALASVGIYPAEIPALVLGALLAALFVWLAWRGGIPQLLALATVGVATLLVTYHRHYDAAVLCLPLAWGISQYQRTRSRLALATTVCCGVFLVPGQVIAGRLSSEYELSPALHSVLSNAFVQSHQAWTLLLLSALLFAQIVVERSRSTDPALPPG